MAAKDAAQTPTADVKVESKSATVTVPADVYKFLDELHWEKRVKLSAILRSAVVEYAERNGFSKPSA